MKAIHRKAQQRPLDAATRFNVSEEEILADLLYPSGRLPGPGAPVAPGAWATPRRRQP